MTELSIAGATFVGDHDFSAGDELLVVLHFSDTTRLAFYAVVASSAVNAIAIEFPRGAALKRLKAFISETG